MKPLVIGGTGFLGLNVVRALTERGITPRCTRRKTSNTLFLRKFKPEQVVASLDDTASLRQAMEGCDTVFMTAGHYPRYSLGQREHIETALRRIDNVIEAALALPIRRFVFTSSVVTMDWQTRPDQILTEDHVATRPPPRSVYHAVKFALERRVLEAVDQGLPAVVLCPTGVVGEYDIKAGTGFFLVALARRMMPSYPDGRINLVDARAVADAHLVAAERDGLEGRRYILAGHNMTVGDLLQRVCDRYDLTPPTRTIPLPIAALTTTWDEWRSSRTKGRRPKLAREFVDLLRFGRFVDPARAVADLDLAVPPFEETLDRAWSWFAKYGYLGDEFKPKKVRN